MSLPTAPQPLQWPIQATKQVYARDLNNQLSNAVAFLAAPPAFMALQGTVQSIPNSGFTNITLDNPILDNYLAQNDNTFAKYTIPAGCGGIWLAMGNASYVLATTADVSSNINLNGTTINGGTYPGGDNPTPLVADLLNISAGQYVCLSGSNASGGSINTNTGSAGCRLSLRWAANSSGTAGLTPPSPASWTALQQCSTANFNAQIYNAVSFLSYVPYFRATQSSSQVLATSTTTGITNMTSTLDNYSAFASNVWTCKVAGTYLVGYQTGFSGVAAVSYGSGVLTKISGVNATYPTPALLGQSNTIVPGIKTFRFGVGDTVQLAGWQNSGGGASTLTGNDTRFFTLWMSS